MSNITDVQLMIGDPATVTPPITDGELFTADQIQTFLTISAAGGVENVYSGSALALRSLAASGVLLAKVEQIGNYSLSRATLVEKFLKVAQVYEDRINEIPAVGVMEQTWTPQNAIEILLNDAQRNW